MITCDSKTHIKILISSINKIYNNAIIKGKLEIKELYYLNIISKLIDKLDLTYNQLTLLKTFYNKLSHYSNFICSPKIIKDYYTPKPHFVQATKEHCDNIPLIDYNIRNCINLDQIDVAFGGTVILDLILNISYITCEGVSITTQHIFTEINDVPLIINTCIQNNTLIINNQLINNLQETIIFIIDNLDPKIEPTIWEVRLITSDCNNLPN